MTTNPSQVDPNKIHLNEVRLFDSHISTSAQFLNNPVLLTRTNVQIGQHTGINLETNACAIRMDIILSALDEKEQEIGLTARYIIHFGFTIDNLQELVQVEGTNNIIDGRLGATLIGMAYSTARGIVLERTHGSFFNGAILPVLNPMDILNAPQVQPPALPTIK